MVNLETAAAAKWAFDHGVVTKSEARNNNADGIADIIRTRMSKLLRNENQTNNIAAAILNQVNQEA